jgi:inner membrane protein
LEGPWPNPSFDGVFLPTKRDITESGFKAQWNILHYNRPFSQQWIEGDENVSDANFGVKFLIPVDQYQKSIRTAKYGQLIILLTFIALFMVEIMKKIRIRPFQYILIGSALIIYYTLLISFSEHVGYNIAYMLSSFATVTLISLYSLTFLETKKLSALLSFLLVFFYSFIFVIIQLQDYSLLLGSIGLFLIIAMVMYFSKNVKWYNQ